VRQEQKSIDEDIHQCSYGWRCWYLFKYTGNFEGFAGVQTLIIISNYPA